MTKRIMEKVERLIDGNTFETVGGRCIRLAHVSVPEAETEPGKAATRALRNLIAGKEVEVQAFFRDRDGRHISKVRIDGQSINLAMNRRLETLVAKEAHA